MPRKNGSKSRRSDVFPPISRSQLRHPAMEPELTVAESSAASPSRAVRQRPVLSRSEILAQANQSLRVHRQLNRNASAELVDAQVFPGTEVRILDHFRDTTSGTVRRYQDLVPIEDVEYGYGHREWLEEKAKRMERWSRTLALDDYTQDEPATCMPHWIALEPYVGYPALYNERIHAHSYPFRGHHSTKPQPTGFHDLPAELRNRIYESVLLLEDPIELAPVSDNHRRCTLGRLRSYEALRESILPLLRVDKTVNMEASEVFYGRNVFRFSHIHGWAVFRAFLRAIGEQNVSRLERIALPVPWQKPSTSLLTSPLSYGFLGTLARPLFRFSTASLDTAFQDCMKVLNKAGNLRRLDLVLDFNLQVDNVIEVALEPESFPQGAPSINLIHLASANPWSRPNGSQLPLVQTVERRKVQDEEGWQVAYGGRKHDISTWELTYRNAEVFAKRHGWSYRLIRRDGEGNFDGDVGYSGSMDGWNYGKDDLEILGRPLEEGDCAEEYLGSFRSRG